MLFILATNPHGKEAVKLKKIHNYFMQLLSNDMATKKPLFIFVDVSKNMATLSFRAFNINYLSIFLKTPEFKTVWKNYHHYATINAMPYYKLDIYELNKK